MTIKWHNMKLVAKSSWMLTPGVPLSSRANSLYLICDAFTYAEQYLYLPNSLVDFHNFKISKAVLGVSNSNRIESALSLWAVCGVGRWSCAKQQSNLPLKKIQSSFFPFFNFQSWNLYILSMKMAAYYLVWRTMVSLRVTFRPWNGLYRTWDLRV